LVLKPTARLSNCEEILKEVSKKCVAGPSGSGPWHRHVPLLGANRARHAERYPPRLVAAILRGLKKHLRQTGQLSALTVGVTCEEENPVDYDLMEEIHDSVAGETWLPCGRSGEKSWR
jgi:hypothetical protein